MEGPVFEAVHDDADGNMLLQNRIFLSDCINQAAGRINRGGDLFSPRPLTLPAVIKQYSRFWKFSLKTARDLLPLT